MSLALERKVRRGPFREIPLRSSPTLPHSHFIIDGRRSLLKEAAEVSNEIEQLLYHEAHLLDAGLFREWLELLAPDVRYWAPARAEIARKQENADQAKQLGLFNETKASLTLRISRLETGLAWVENPTTRTRRFITNVTAQEQANGLFGVRSNFLLFRSRSFDDETILVGCREDTWCKPEKWLLKERKILIDHCAVENMSLLL